ncbi:MAG: Tol-Pal system beta propeller repeat protein TolB, partial [bacterium]
MQKRNKLNRSWLIFSLIVCPSLGLAQTDVYLRVYTKTFQRMEIDLFAFAGEPRGGPANDFANLIRDVLSNDLWMSGYFKVNIKSGLPENNARDGHNVNSTDSGQTLARVTGTFRFDVNGFTIRPMLVDNASGRTIFKSEHYGRTGTERAVIHQIADDIVYSLTGERGIARSKIAFVEQGKNGAKEIGIMDYDGYGSTLLTSDNSINLSPAWSPDGDHICYTSYQSDNPDLYVKNLRTNSEIRLSHVKGLNSAPAWSPDGSKIALTLSKDGNAEIYLFDIESKKLRRLTYNRAIDSSPTWSPSNREIAFTSDRLGSPQVYIMDADGVDVRRLTYQGSY